MTISFSWAENGEHKLTVTATDKSGKSATKLVILTVEAVENIPPSFPYDEHTIEIPETTPPGSPIYRVMAHDPDGQDAALRYYIHSQPEPDLFTINQSTGMILLSSSGKLDFETKIRLYTLTIRVQDQGNPSEMATTLIHIPITDVNDELPRFKTPNYVVDMSESAKADHIVVQLQATDPDKNAKLEYDISCPCQVWDASGTLGSPEDAEQYFSYLR